MLQVLAWYTFVMQQTLDFDKTYSPKQNKKKTNKAETNSVNGQPAARTDCLEEDHLSTSQPLLGSKTDL